jgi:hypothetical protein
MPDDASRTSQILLAAQLHALADHTQFLSSAQFDNIAHELRNVAALLELLIARARGSS